MCRSCMHYLNKAYIIATFGLFDHNCSLFFSFFFAKNDQTPTAYPLTLIYLKLELQKNNTLLVTVILTVDAAK